MTRRDKEIFDAIGISTDDMPDPAERLRAQDHYHLASIEQAAVEQDEQIRTLRGHVRQLIRDVRDTRWIADNWRAATVVLAIIEAVQVVRWWVR